MIQSLRSSCALSASSSSLSLRARCFCSAASSLGVATSSSSASSMIICSSSRRIRGSHDDHGLFTPTLTLLKPMRRRHLPVREPQAGDWVCSCGHSNSKFRRDCIKCNGPAPPLPLGESRPKLPGEDPHDWACACGKMNYRGNVNCHKCGMPKPPSVEQETKIQQNMWKCAKCACLNRSNRKFCFQCRALQTLSGQQVDKEGKTTAPQQ